MTDTEIHERDRRYLTECLTRDLIKMLIEDRGISMEDAMDLLFNSHTYEKIENERTGLYYQSAVYVMDMLDEELSNQNHLLSTDI